MAQDGPYQVIPPEHGDFFIWATPGVEKRRYADGQIAVFGPVVPLIRSFAEHVWNDFFDEEMFDRFPGLPEPVRVARQGVLKALEALIAACDPSASAT